MTVYSNQASMRLTLRGRRVLAALTLGVIIAVVTPAVTDLAGANSDGGKTTQIAKLITVQPGDTLWQIAAEIAPDRDSREVVWEIKQLNSLPAGLIAGDQIRIPLD